MPIESNSDRQAYMDVFGVEVTLNPDTTKTKIQAIFDNAHIEIEGNLSVLSTSTPMLTVRTIDVSGVLQGHELLVENTRYRVRDIQPDGTGITQIELHKV